MFIVPLTSMPSIEALNTIDKNDRPLHRTKR